MKIKNKILILILILVLSMVFLLDRYINSDENKNYLEKIMVDDYSFHHEYGLVKKYTIKKVGRTTVGADKGGYDYYDYYDIYVNGQKKSGLIAIKLYKNKKNEVIRYDLK